MTDNKMTELCRLSDVDGKEEEYIVDKLVPKGWATIINGQGGTFKSFSSLYMAYCVARGIPYLGFKTQKTNVLYIDKELVSNQHATRLKSIANHFKTGKPNNIFYYRDSKPLIDSTVLNDFIKMNSIGLVILDSFGFAFGDKLSGKKLDNVFDFLNRLNTTVFIVDHKTKMGKLTGSERKRDYARSVIDVTLDEKQDNSIIMNFDQSKHNFGELQSDNKVKMTFHPNQKNPTSISMDRVGLVIPIQVGFQHDPLSPFSIINGADNTINEPIDFTEYKTTAAKVREESFMERTIRLGKEYLRNGAK